MDRTQSSRFLAVGTPLGEDVLLLRGMKVSEELGRLFNIELDLLSEKKDIDVNKIIGKNVTVRLELSREQTRYFNGYVSRFAQAPQEGRLFQYQATVVPWLWFLTRTADCRIFQNKKAPDIILEVFRGHGYTDFRDALSGEYPKWEYCVQYRETDFDFVSRLMEQEGIYYYFEHENGKHTLVLIDSMATHKPYPNFEELKYNPLEEARYTGEYVYNWQVETTVQPGSFAFTDFDFKNPNKDLQARSKVDRPHDASGFEIYDYHG